MRATSLTLSKVPFDVNDVTLRTSLMRETLPLSLRSLDAATRPLWGRMSPQQMVEHLRWVFQLSTGRASVTCPIDEKRQLFFRKFLHANMPAPRNFMNPVLTRGLPPNREENLDDAKAALLSEAKHFLHSTPASGQRYDHPLYGPLNRDEWERAHYKHIHHHLVQFGLIDSSAMPTGDDIPEPPER